jgi:hypothetical protein
MPKNLAVLLYVIFAALALVSKLDEGIEQIADAQLWPYSPPIDNQYTNNLPFNTVNKNPIQPSNVKTSVIQIVW